MEIYKLTKTFPDDERFGLISQMRRAAVSIPSNIAEGWGRRARNDYVRFLKMAAGSCYELHTQVRLAKDLGYHAETTIFEMLNETERVLNGLIRSLDKRTLDNP